MASNGLVKKNHKLPCNLTFLPKHSYVHLWIRNSSVPQMMYHQGMRVQVRIKGPIGKY